MGEGGVRGQGCKAPHPYSPQQRHACRHSQATPTCIANRYISSKGESWATLITHGQQTPHARTDVDKAPSLPRIGGTSH